MSDQQIPHLDSRQDKLKKFKEAGAQVFGGPGSGPNPGGGKGDGGDDEEISRIAKVPKEERTSAMMKKMLDNMDTKSVKELTAHNKKWLKDNEHVSNTPKYKAIEREHIVGENILTERSKKK